LDVLKISQIILGENDDGRGGDWERESDWRTTSFELRARAESRSEGILTTDITEGVGRHVWVGLRNV